MAISSLCLEAKLKHSETVIGFSKYLATYWAHDNIRVNILTPGGIESGQNETFKKNYSSRVPLGRMGMANELHGALLFLASDAASYVTGQNIIVDGHHVGFAQKKK